MRHWLGLGLTLLLLVQGSARAQHATPEQHVDAAARAAFEAGRASYEAGRFGEALAQYERAYLLSPRPALLYDIARAAESDGHNERAISAYTRYLELLPNAENRQFAEARLRKLRADAARSEAPPAAHVPAPAPAAPPIPLNLLPPPGPTAAVALQVPREPARAAPLPAAPAPTKPRPFYKSPWLWSGVGVLLAGAAVGLGVGLRPDEPRDEPFRGSSGLSLGAP